MSETDAEYNERKIVLRHLILRSAMMKAVCEDVQKTQMFLNHKDLGLIWNVAYLYWKSYGGGVPFEVLSHDLRQCGSGAGILDSEVEQLCDMLKSWYSNPEFYDKYVQDLVTAYLKDYATYHLRENLDIKSPEELAGEIEQTSQVFRTNPFQRPEIRKPFENLQASLHLTPKIAFGVPFLDLPLGGGTRYGEAVGFIAPSGGGKTTIALQVAAGQVRHQKHVLYLSAEQPYEGDIATRICALATGMKREAFDGGFAKIPPDALALLDTAMPLWNTYFHFVDLSDLDYEIQDVPAIFRPYEDLLRQGIHAELIILDWWGEVRDRLEETNSKKFDSAQRRESRSYLSALKRCIKSDPSDLKNRPGTRLLVTHQLSGQASSKSPTYRVRTKDAQEDKNFDNRMDFCFVASGKDSDDNVRFYLDKARSTANWQGVYRLDGPHCLFESTDPEEGTTSAVVERRKDTTSGYAEYYS
jgi:hypothetical protein